MWGWPFRGALPHAGMVRAFGAWVSENATVEIAKQGAVKFVIAWMGPIAALDAATVVVA